MAEPPLPASLTFVPLEERPLDVPLVAGWWFDEWGHLAPGSTVDDVLDELRTSLNDPGLPIAIVAVENDIVVGSAVLKLHELRSLYPDRKHWLGNVLVEPARRGRGIASALSMRIVRIAKDMGIGELHLQTLDLSGGLYEKLGWTAIEQVHHRGHDVLVMAKQLTIV